MALHRMTWESWSYFLIAVYFLQPGEGTKCRHRADGKKYNG